MQKSVLLSEIKLCSKISKKASEIGWHKSFGNLTLLVNIIFGPSLWKFLFHKFIQFFTLEFMSSLYKSPGGSFAIEFREDHTVWVSGRGFILSSEILDDFLNKIIVVSSSVSIEYFVDFVIVGVTTEFARILIVGSAVHGNIDILVMELQVLVVVGVAAGRIGFGFRLLLFQLEEGRVWWLSKESKSVFKSHTKVGEGLNFEASLDLSSRYIPHESRNDNCFILLHF